MYLTNACIPIKVQLTYRLKDVDAAYPIIQAQQLPDQFKYTFYGKNLFIHLSFSKLDYTQLGKFCFLFMVQLAELNMLAISNMWSVHFNINEFAISKS